MAEIQEGPLEKLIEGVGGLCSVTEDLKGNLFAVSLTGSIYQVVNGQLSEVSNTNGQPSGICFDNETSYICDMAHQAIIVQSLEKSKEDFNLIKEWEGKPLLGPNSIAYNQANNCLYFTDSGPMGESSLVSPKGSLFFADLEEMRLVDLAVKCLAHPSGIAITPDGSRVFIAETLRNRILRLSISGTGVSQLTVFHQFSGRLGPTAVAISENEVMCVANYEFKDYSEDGVLSVLSLDGELKGKVTIPNAPEITGLFFSRKDPNTLYIVESSTSTIYKKTLTLTNS